MRTGDETDGVTAVAAVKPRKILRSEDPVATGDGDLLPALRTGFARAAKDLLDLPLAVIGVTTTPAAEPDVPQLCEDGPMCLVFGTGDDLQRAVLVSADLVAALVRHQTIGRIADSGRGEEPRSLTGTDAALCAPLITAALARVASIAPDAAAKAGLDRDLPCTWVATAHDLQIALGPARFRRITLRIDLGGGAVSGTLELLLAQIPPPDPEPVARDAPPRQPASIFLEVRAELDAVLCKLSLPLTALSELAVGDVVPLSAASVERTALVGLDGQEVASAVLGQLNGARAVRLAGSDGQVARIADRGAAPAKFEQAATSAQPPAPLPKPAPPPMPEETLAEPDFEGMSIEDAAAEITSLAGLTEEDLAEINAAATADVVGQPV